MRSRLHNLAIKNKFAVVIIPLIVTIILFDYFQIHDDFLDYKDSIRLNKAIIVGIEINHVVHEIQKERGITSGFLSKKGRQSPNWHDAPPSAVSRADSPQASSPPAQRAGHC